METIPALIMVVDDDPLVREMIGQRLDLEGYAVIAVSDADQAVEILEHKTVDAVISDVQMPGNIDGVGLAKWVEENAPCVPVLLTSGNPEAGQRVPTIPIFKKPFRMTDLLLELGSRVRRRWRASKQGKGHRSRDGRPNRESTFPLDARSWRDQGGRSKHNFGWGR
jgi:DNA-binding response OmpR family regulator